VLLKNGITSAPVYDSSRNVYVGMFDYGDLMTYILLLLKKMDTPLEDQTMEMRDLIQRTSKNQNVPVKLASDLSGKDPFCTVLTETRLGAVVHDFGTGIHRVAVMGAEGNMKGILSQSSALDYLMRHVSLIFQYAYKITYFNSVQLKVLDTPINIAIAICGTLA
ncbi:cell separation during budding, partial [Entomortierella beljakovae]